MDQIVIHGARQHNLKNIDLSLPRDRLIVITGVSGSGKSSLAFDTLYAEGQRRYLEALSSHTRQFLQKLDAPQVDEIEGLSPAIAIEQKGMARNPRSTVGTLTEIHDYLRLLYARLGTVYCPSCRRPIRAHTILQMAQELLDDWPQGSRMWVLAPLGTLKESGIAGTVKKLRRDGYVRIRLDGEIYELDPPPRVPRRPSYKIDVVIDRLVLSESKTQRLSDSLELASKMGEGSVVVLRQEGEEKHFSQVFRCTSCGRGMPLPSPSLFSFHHPSGTCPECKGLGYVARGRGDSSDEAVRHARRPAVGPGDAAAVGRAAPSHPCPHCLGSRLNEAARSVRLGEQGIHEVSRLPAPEVARWLSSLELTQTQAQIASRPRQAILQRLKALEELGLGYLTLDRPAPTLSGGEAQRIRLSHQIASPLSGALYVLDEPSIGLHPRDHQRLLDILFRLRDAGNTVVVVEHDRDTILQADHVVDMGPGAGSEGGEVIFSGAPKDLLRHPTSLTGQFLSGRRAIPVPSRRPCFSEGEIRLAGARGHNLKGITVEFPLGCIICVTGVSGSGKSTLVLHTLYRELSRRLYGSKLAPEPFDRMEGSEGLTKVILIDQSPLGRTPRSTPATYVGVLSLIRQLFSQIPEARARGYGPSRFSFNARGGRCETCKGEGLQKIEMFFLPDIFVTCPACDGRRYARHTLEVLLKGKSIADVLEMTVHEAAAFFENFAPMRHKLDTLQEVGLGYLRLGQPATTLSGGEAQRVKLAGELSRRSAGKALYILDEPTTGLHFDDVQKLLHILQRLVDQGHTVLMIEHHPDVIKTADHVIDLGPEGGEEGGYLVASGTPEDIAGRSDSYTGKYLRKVLGGAGS